MSSKALFLQMILLHSLILLHDLHGPYSSFFRWDNVLTMSQKGGRMGIRLWHAVNYHVTAGVMTSEAA